LLRCLERDSLPARDAFRGVRRVPQANIGEFSHNRYQADDTQLGGFLHDQIKLLALQQGDCESQLQWGFGASGCYFLNDLETSRVTTAFFDATMKLFSFTIENIDFVTHLQAQNFAQVVRLV
jgi:hypothetical protein